MRITVLLTFLVIGLLIVPGCQQKKADVTGWQSYTNDFFKVTFTYPAGWVPDSKSNQATVYSSAEAAQKFFDHDQRKPDGVQLIVAAEPGKYGKDASAYIQAHKEEQTASGFSAKEIEQTKIEGLPAAMVQYVGNYDDVTKVTTIRAAVVKDSVLYYVQYAAFNDLFQPYRFVFDSAIASLALPRKIVVEKGVDPAIPFATTQKFQNAELAFEFPENFGVTPPPLKGEQTLRLQVMGNLDGARQDCSIDISVRPAKKLTVEKVAEQNVKNFSPTSSGEVKVSGEKSIYFNYKIKDARFASIKSRVYFVVKNDKLYQVIMNYYAPKEKDFLPAFEKLVASIQIK